MLSRQHKWWADLYGHVGRQEGWRDGMSYQRLVWHRGGPSAEGAGVVGWRVMRKRFGTRWLVMRKRFGTRWHVAERIRQREGSSPRRGTVR